MNKIELKHLAAYLPYRVKVENLNFKIDYTGVKYSELTNLYCVISKDNIYYWQYKTDVGNTAPIERCKLILRPLTDLKKTIKIYNNDFTPMRYFYELYGSGYDSYEKYCIHEKFTLTENHSLYFKDACKLFEWHFDVFGLIDKGLAIDTNEINKES